MTNVITQYRILPQQGGGVCVVGTFKGACVVVPKYQTTRIVSAKAGMVKTESGSIYTLQDMEPGMWLMQIKMKRPSEAANLERYGLI